MPHLTPLFTAQRARAYDARRAHLTHLAAQATRAERWTLLAMAGVLLFLLALN